MSFFHRASDFTINNATFVNNVNSGVSALHYLSRLVANGASHTSKDQCALPKCHEDTRTLLLDDIHEWIKMPDKERGIMLLHGPAGAGKSCIARSACEKAASEGLLGASFFFWRSATGRKSMDMLFTTIAYQLAMANSELGQYIMEVVEQNPRIHDESLDLQFQKLVYEPCIQMSLEGRRLNGAIVLDGLDECMDAEMQIAVLQLLAKAVRYENFPLGFFITSRPELHLQEALDTKKLIFATNVVSLSTVAGISQDILTVLESGFGRIMSDPRFKIALKAVCRPWPSRDSIDTLVRRSSGQFIYAATVMKFVSSPDHSPAAQLDIVLGIRECNSSDPLADLDLLYHEILSRVRDPARTIRILGYIIAIKQAASNRCGLAHHRQLCIALGQVVVRNQQRLLLVLEHLLDLPPGEAYLALNQLHSLVFLKVGSESYRRTLDIQFYHRSFQDFLTKKRRSKEFFVNPNKIHFDIAQSCLNFMNQPTFDTQEQYVSLIYSCFTWFSHLYRSKKHFKLQIPDLCMKRMLFMSSENFDNAMFRGALVILGLDNLERVKMADGSRKALRHFVKYGSPSELERYSLALDIHLNQLKFFGAGREHERECFRNSFLFPSILWYFLSLNNDQYIKRVLIIRLILLFNTMCEEVNIFSKLVENKNDTNIHQLDLFKISPHNYQIFLSNSRYSGPLCCTPDDYASGYTHFLLTLLQNPALYQFTRYYWIESLEYLSPPATAKFMQCLESTAYIHHSHDKCNMRLTHRAHERLLTWLQKLKNPPENVITAWRMAFEKARRLTLDGVHGYNNYFCELECPNGTCPGTKQGSGITFRGIRNTPDDYWHGAYPGRRMD